MPKKPILYKVSEGVGRESRWSIGLNEARLSGAEVADFSDLSYNLITSVSRFGAVYQQGCETSSTTRSSSAVEG